MIKNSFWIPEIEYISIFRKRIEKWFRKNKRIFPWRNTRDPFRVLIAEMMLRRTRADQVEPVYNRLFREYRSSTSLARAKSEKLTKILIPLGLKWRIPAFKSVAIELSRKHHNKVPLNREELKTLPGVGDYVAGAVLSIAHNKREWIVDSNIVRVFKRYFGIRTTKEGRRDRHVIEIAKRYVLCNSPKNANLALLDFSSLVCKPIDPICNICPLSDACSFKKE